MSGFKFFFFLEIPFDCDSVVTLSWKVGYVFLGLQEKYLG